MAASPAATLAGLRIAIGSSAWAAPNLTTKLFGLDPKNNPQSSFLRGCSAFATSLWPA